MKRVPLNRDNWIVSENKALAIIDEGLWKAVKARQDVLWAASDKIREAMGAQARLGRKGKFLLSGILKCGKCGENLSLRDGKRYAAAHTFTTTPATMT